MLRDTIEVAAEIVGQRSSAGRGEVGNSRAFNTSIQGHTGETSIVIKSVLCLLAFSLTPLGVAGQQTILASVAGGDARAVLPEAPEPQGAAAFSSSLQTPQTPTPQQKDPPAPAPAANAQEPLSPAQIHAEAEREIHEQESQRMLGLMPAFNAVLNGKAVPLTSGQKFKLFFRGSIDPFQFAIAGIDSAVEQAQDEYPEYGQGAKGYAKRYGASFTDSFDGNFWGNAVLPSLLHQDPRYFRLGHGKVLHRILYSATTTVRCKGDNGNWQPNYSNILGNFIGGAISNAYYPASDRGAVLTIERGITVSAEGILGAMAIEFYPDYTKWRQRRRERKLEAAKAAAQ